MHVKKVAPPPQLLKLTTRLAAVLALLVALLPPALFGVVTYREGATRLEGQLVVAAELVNQFVGRNPQFWQFETARLKDAIGFVTRTDQMELLVVRDQEEREIASVGDESLAWPTLCRIVPIYDAGRQVGTIDGDLSMRGPLKELGLVVGISALLAIAVFAILRSLPLKALDRALRQVAYLAEHDVLTDLPNRALCRERLSEALIVAKRDAGSLAVLCIDLDRFKEINDGFGQAIGDEVLRHVARRLSGCAAPGDTLARLDGDEFALVAGGLHEPGDAVAIADRLLASMAEPIVIDRHEIAIGLSIGIAFTPRGNVASEAILLEQAVLALQRAKSDGRGRARFFEDAMDRELRERRSLERDLRAAIAGQGIEVHYQPIIALASDRIIGVEALARWRHPELGPISPGKFIPLAEEAGLMVQLGGWILERACRDLADLATVKLAVNLSPAQLEKPDLVDDVARILARTGMDPRRLELEITEGMLIRNEDLIRGVLQQLKDLGVRIAMDDFGTGYSSFGYLRSFPFDKLKIDRSFVVDLEKGRKGKDIVRAILDLARGLGMTTTAEGIERRDQAQFLADAGCVEAQGFLYSPAVPIQRLRDMVAAGTTLAIVDGAGAQRRATDLAAMPTTTRDTVAG